MLRLTFAIIGLFSVLGCREFNPESCENPEKAGKGECPLTGGKCHADPDCAAFPQKICDPLFENGTCVVCTTDNHAACQDPTMPACVDHQCAKCAEHSQCDSKVCLLDGTCADASQVAYVTTSGPGTMCTLSAPCNTLNDAIKAAKPIVKIDGSINDPDVASITKKVDIFASSGSTLTCRKPGATILEAKDAMADVTVYDLEITGETGSLTDTAVSLTGNGTPKLTLISVKIDRNVGIGVSAAAGVLTMMKGIISDNGGIGVSATSSSITISQSTISINRGGGISIAGTGGSGLDSDFDLTNNFIIGNGGAAATIGGVLITNVETTKRKFDFNTVAANITSATVQPGLRCSNVDQDVTFSNSIIYGNVPIGGIAAQVGGGHCLWTFSDIEASPSPFPGTGNKNVDPMFSDPPSANYHLKPGSPVKDTADPADTLNVDFDGESRPQNGRSDMGADEIIVP